MILDLRIPLTGDEAGRLSAAGVALDDGKVALLENPDLFVAHYFRHKLDRLKEFHLDLIRCATQVARGLELFPAGHGKTTLTSTCLPCWGAARNPDIRIGLIAKNEDDRDGISNAIKAEFEDNAELIRDFGPFRPPGRSGKRWSASAIDVHHRQLRSQRPTIQFYGSGGNVYGHRTDWTICDDVVTDKNSATPEMRARTREWFNLGVETMPEHDDSRLTVVGTRFHPEDLYGDLLEMRDPFTDEPIYLVSWHDAIVDEEKEITLWAERWTWKRLMVQRAKMGTLDFNKRYRNIAVDPSRMVFREEFVRGGYIGADRFPGCLDRDFKVGDIDEGWHRYGGLDPASSKTGRRSWTVNTILMVGSCEQHEKCFWIVDMERDQLTVPKQADMAIEKHLQYGLTTTKIEANAYQAGLREVIDERMHRRGIALRMEEHQTGNNKLDPEIGVQAMGPYVEKGMFHIPWGDDYSRRRMKQLVDELINYPNFRTTDCVMSLWIGWLNAKDSAPRHVCFNRLSKRQDWTKSVGTGWVLQNPYYARDEENVGTPG